MSKKSNGSKWCTSWKSLLKTSLMVSSIFAVLHFVGLVFWYNDINEVHQVVHQTISAVIICHIAFVAFFGCYITNYKYLVSTQAMEQSSKRFWLGLSPIIIGELLNITALIGFFVET